MTKRQRLALIAVILSSSVVFLDGSIVNLALPKIAHDLGAGFSSLQWVAEGYLLSLSALILLGGTLGDIRGRKRIYMVGLAGFGVTSLLCAVMPSIQTLIAARILQGVFGALLIPGALAIIETNFPAHERGPAFGHWTAWTSAAMAVGPLLGGYLIDTFSWRWIFFINIPLLIASFMLARRGIKESHDPAPRRLDLAGAWLGAMALVGVTYGLIEGPVQHWGWLSSASLGLGVVLAVVFVMVERRVSDPMLSLELFRSQNFDAANLTTFALYGALGGFFFALTIYLQTTVGFSSLEAGLSTLPVTLFLVFLSSRFGAIAGRVGARRFMTAGPILVGLGIFWLWPLHHGAVYWRDILPGICLFGLGMSMTVAPLTTTVMAAVGHAHSGIASAVNNAVARVSGLLIIALLGLLGTAYVYQFTVVLCGVLAIVAGLTSYALLREHRLKPNLRSGA